LARVKSLAAALLVAAVSDRASKPRRVFEIPTAHAELIRLSPMLNDPISYGYIGIVLFLILTGCGLPLPEEVAIIGAGVAAGRGVLNPWFALASCLIGAIAGDSAMYWIGRVFGEGILKRQSRWTRFLNPEREKLIEKLLQHHGVKVLLVTRFLVGLRSPVYFAAGMLRASYIKFLIADTCCALLVTSSFFGVTYFFGAKIWNLIKNVETLITVALVAAAVIGLLIFFIQRRGKALLQAEADLCETEQSAAAPEPQPKTTQPTQ
jgi:membrane protein DedA with SNARE-associated domain